MNVKAEAHLAQVKEQFLHFVDDKYRKGQLEHGGYLTDKTIEQLTDLALDEAIDQVVYLLTLRNKLNEHSI